MYTTKEGKKYGSAFVGKRKDAEHEKPEEKFSSYQDGEQPEAKASSEDHDGDKVNTSEKSPEGHDPNAVGSDSPAPHEVVEEHGPAEHIHYEHDHEAGTHKVTSFHPETGHEHQSVHSSAAEAYEAGGELANTDVKRREHSEQQGAEPEEKNYEAPETA